MAKTEGWTPPFICCALDRAGSAYSPPPPHMINEVKGPFTFTIEATEPFTLAFFTFYVIE